MRQLVILACQECKRRNYTTKKNKQNDPDRVELKKYCKWCAKHTLHKETRQSKLLDVAIWETGKKYCQGLLCMLHSLWQLERRGGVFFKLEQNQSIVEIVNIDNL